MVEKKLAGYGANPETHCSEAFINSLKKFLETRQNKLKQKIESNLSGDNNSEILEDTAYKVSGITKRQLEVTNSIAFCLIPSCIYKIIQYFCYYQSTSFPSLPSCL